ncbi:hypothetical protein Lal_00021751 [Lupinus albus]|nr:hypothetical protein Lal_00021751 [Lupinus albus]
MILNHIRHEILESMILKHRRHEVLENVVVVMIKINLGLALVVVVMIKVNLGLANSRCGVGDDKS